MSRFWRLAILAFAFGFPLGAVAATKANTVTLQLQWDHQFQFAGYYAALWKGFYAEEGLTVTIRSAFEPDGKFHKPTEEVATGRADFGVGAIDILKARDQGRPLVILASVYQHSPVAFYARAGTELRSPADLTRLTVATRGINGRAYPELMAMLRAENIPPARIRTQPIRLRLGLRDLSAGNVDVAAGFTISAGWIARELNLALTALYPSSYGVDFYGGALFTHKRLLDQSPETAEAFIRASLKGWRYALTHGEEIADRIAAELPRRIPLKDARGFNRFQIEQVARLIQADVITLGHINHARWGRMHAALKDIGLVKGQFEEKQAIYDRHQLARDRITKTHRFAIGLTIAALTLGLGFWLVTVVRNRRLKQHTTQQLRESEAKYRAIMAAQPDLIFMLSREGVHLDYYASSLEDLLVEPEKFLGRRVDEVLPADIAELYKKRISDTLRTQQLQQFEYQLDFEDGYRSFDCRMVVSGKDQVLAIVRDVTAQRETAKQLQQAQKMEAVGQLTGGIAHDFNNLLAVALGNVELAEDAARSGGDVRPYLAAIKRATERGASLTHQLLAFSRRQTLFPVALDVGKLTREMTDLLSRTLGETIEVKVTGQDGLWLCEADPNLLESAILNLAINARDAMPQGGTLTITTGNARFDGEDAGAQSGSKPGDYVMVAVSDTGTGMSKDVMEHVFDPFFTTKEVGRGTGLGLSMVYGFVKQSGGHVTVESEEGLGTTIKLYLPRSVQAEEELTEADGDDIPESRGETVLVVEDDADVRTLSVSLLTALGYGIVEAADGHSALRALEKAPRVNLLFTDVVLPGGMNGGELAAEVQKRHPGLPVLYTSGYAELSNFDSSALDKRTTLLHKPYRLSELARKVRAALDAAVV
ncbi:MAG: ABC transporter substrate-binding protein [Alphaproteobacteria bacterium]|nr:ABC transporter substrate-binding protein [Alphaproteobacteria bacterium]